MFLEWGETEEESESIEYIVYIIPFGNKNFPPTDTDLW